MGEARRSIAKDENDCFNWKLGLVTRTLQSDSLTDDVDDDGELKFDESSAAPEDVSVEQWIDAIIDMLYLYYEKMTDAAEFIQNPPVYPAAAADDVDQEWGEVDWNSFIYQSVAMNQRLRHGVCMLFFYFLDM